MRGLAAVAALRFREALAGRLLWLLPLHFVLALAAARAMPGPSPAARREAADATALALAAALGLAAAAVLGASPLPDERERARGTLVLAAPPGAAARVLGTALGAGAALLLLVAALCASALGAVDLGAGAGTEGPRAFVRAWRMDGGEPDPREPGLVWLTAAHPFAEVYLRDLASAPALLVEARPRVGTEGSMPGVKRASFSFSLHDAPEFPTVAASAGLPSPFRVEVPPGAFGVIVQREPGNLDLGLRLEGIRLDAGPRSRALARGLHALALLAGLAAAAAAALALSTVAGTGVAAAGALALSLLALFRTTFAEAAETLAHAGAVDRARAAAEAGGSAHLHEAVTGTPPALAPLFRALAAALPDGTRFDLGTVVAANEVPDPGDAGRAALAGLVLAVVFLALAIPGARRRP